MNPARENEIGLKDVLAANLHETKNLMGQLMLRLDAMGTSEPPVREARFLCQQISDRMVQMLLLFELRGEQLKSQPEAHNPADFLLELRENARAWAGEQLVIESRDEGAPDYWYFDRALTEMALMNALHNAFRHARQRIELVTGMRGDCLYFSVRDDGAGFPDSVLHVAGGHSLPISRDGTGLGLYFARMIAAVHTNQGRSGSLELRNNESGSGAEFTLLLPK